MNLAGKRNIDSVSCIKISQHGYSLQNTDDTPFFHHIAVLSELNQGEGN
jgi:hypothetical protein